MFNSRRASGLAKDYKYKTQNVFLRVECVNGDIRTAGGWFQAISGKGPGIYPAFHQHVNRLLLIFF